MSRRMKEKEEKFSSGASIERASDCLRHIFGKIKWRRKVATLLVAAMLTGTMSDGLAAVGVAGNGNVYASSSNARVEDDSGGGSSQKGKHAADYYLEDAKEDLDIQLDSEALQAAMESDEPLQMDLQYLPFEDESVLVGAYDQIVRETEDYRLLDQGFLQDDTGKVSYLVFGRVGENSSGWMDNLKVIVINGNEKEQGNPGYNVSFTIDGGKITLTEGQVEIQVFDQAREEAADEPAQTQGSSGGGSAANGGTVQVPEDVEDTEAEVVDPETDAVDPETDAENEESEAVAPGREDSDASDSKTEDSEGAESSLEETAENETDPSSAGETADEDDQSEETETDASDETQTSTDQSDAEKDIAEEPDQEDETEDAEKADAADSQDEETADEAERTEDDVDAGRDEESAQDSEPADREESSDDASSPEKADDSDVSDSDEAAELSQAAYDLRNISVSRNLVQRVTAASASNARKRLFTADIENSVESIRTSLAEQDLKVNLPSEEGEYEFTQEEIDAINMMDSQEKPSLFAMLRSFGGSGEVLNTIVSPSYSITVMSGQTSTSGPLDRADELYGGKELGDELEFPVTKVTPFAMDRDGKRIADGDTLDLEAGSYFALLFEIVPQQPDTWGYNGDDYQPLYDRVDTAELHFKLPAGLSPSADGVEIDQVNDEPVDGYNEFTITSTNLYPGGNRTIQIHVYLDGNGELAHGEKFTFGEEWAWVISTITAIDRSNNEEKTYEVPEYADAYDMTVSSYVPDEWGIAKDLVQAGSGQNAMDWKKVTEDGNDYAQIEYTIKVGLLDEDNQITDSDDDYLRTGRTGFKTFSITDEITIPKLEGLNPSSVSVVMGDKQLPVTLDGNRFIITDYQELGQESGSGNVEVAATAPGYTEYDVTVRYPYEKFLLAYYEYDELESEDDKETYLVNNEVTLKYELSGKEEVTVSDTETAVVRDRIEPVILRIAKNIEDATADNKYDPYNTRIAGTYSGYAEFTITVWDETEGKYVPYTDWQFVKSSYKGSAIMVNPRPDDGESADVVTGDDGYIEVYLEPGKDYQISEVKAPNYTIAASPQEVTSEQIAEAMTTADHTVRVTFNNDLSGQGGIRFRKGYQKIKINGTSDKGVGLANIQFGLFPAGTTEFTAENAILTVKSDSSGYVTFYPVTADANDGTEYIVREYGNENSSYRENHTPYTVKVISGEIVTLPIEGNVEQDPDNSSLACIYNDINTASVTLTKMLVNDDGKTEKVPSTRVNDFVNRFTLQKRNADGTWSDVGTKSLSSNAAVTWSNVERYDKTTDQLIQYRIRETIPDGYNATQAKVDGTAANLGTETGTDGTRYAYVYFDFAEDASGAPKNVTAELVNTRTGNLTVTKKLWTYNASGSVSKTNGEGWTIGLFTKSADTYTLAGSTQVTAQNGTVKFTGLQVLDGVNQKITYYIGEAVQQNSNYLLDGDYVEQNVGGTKYRILTEGVNVSSISDVTKEIVNVQQKIPFWIKKVDAETKQFPTVSGSPQYANITITESGETEAAASGVNITSAGGYLFLADPGTTYTVVENQAPNGYYVNNSSMSFAVPDDLTITTENMEKLLTDHSYTDASGEKVTLEYVIANDKKPQAAIQKFNESRSKLAISFDVYTKNTDGSFKPTGQSITTAAGTTDNYITLEAGTAYYFREAANAAYMNPYFMTDEELGEAFTDEYHSSDSNLWEKPQNEQAVYFGPFTLSVNEKEVLFRLENRVNTGSITAFKKIPANNTGSLTPQAGAVFTLTWTNDEGKQETRTFTSDTAAGGNVRFSNLRVRHTTGDYAGEYIQYTLTETKAPDGYTQSARSYTITLTEGKNTTTDINSQDLEFINIPKVSVGASKTWTDLWQSQYDRDNKKASYYLPGVEIALFRAPVGVSDTTAAEYVATATTDANGAVLFRNVDWGNAETGKAYTYYMTEVALPETNLGIVMPEGTEALPENYTETQITVGDLESKYNTVNITPDPSVSASTVQGGQADSGEKILDNPKPYLRFDFMKICATGDNADHLEEHQNEVAQLTSEEKDWTDEYVELEDGYHEKVDGAEFTLYRYPELVPSLDLSQITKGNLASWEVVNTYESGALVDASGEKIHGWVATEPLDMGYVYVMVETQAAPGYQLPDPAIVGIFYPNVVNGETFQPSGMPASGIRAEEYDAVWGGSYPETYDYVENPHAVGPGTDFFADVKFNKWSAAFGDLENPSTYEPLGGATFNLYLLDGNGNRVQYDGEDYLLDQDIMTGLENDGNVNSDSTANALSKIINIGQLNDAEYCDGFFKQYVTEGTATPEGGTTSVSYLEIQVELVETYAPNGYETAETGYQFTLRAYEGKWREGLNTNDEYFYIKATDTTEASGKAIVDSFYEEVNVTLANYGFMPENDDMGKTISQAAADRTFTREDLIPGAVYTLQRWNSLSGKYENYEYAGGNGGSTITIGSDGTYTFPKGLPTGDYRLIEVTPSEGYYPTYDSEAIAKTFTVTYQAQTVNLYNPEKPDIVVTKNVKDQTSEDDLAGITFTLSGNGSSRTAVTRDINGTYQAVFAHVDCGTYTLSGEQVPAETGTTGQYFTSQRITVGYQYQAAANAAEKSFTALGDNVQLAQADITVTNPRLGSLKIAKIDPQISGGNNQLAGAAFKVEFQPFGSGDIVDGKLNKELPAGSNWAVIKTETEATTEETPVITLPNLVPGWYRITEAKAPQGYTLNLTPVIVALTTDMTNVAAMTAEAEVENLKKVSFRLTKQLDFGSVFDEAELDQIKENGLSFTIYRGTLADNKLQSPIAIRSINLKNFAEISGQPGIYQASSEVILLDQLTNDQVYAVKESAPNGWTLLAEVNNVPATVTEDGYLILSGNYQQGTQEVTVTLENRYDKASIVITKADADDQEPLTGAVFGLYSDANTNTRIGQFTDNRDGTYSITVAANNPAGTTYWIKEEKAPANYVLNPTPVEITVRPGQKLTATSTPSLRIFNEAGFDLYIHKYDNVKNRGEQLLRGVSFYLYTRTRGTQDWTLYRQEPLVTGTNGQIFLSGLDLSEAEYAISEVPYGKYVLDSVEIRTGNQSAENAQEIVSSGRDENGYALYPLEVTAGNTYHVDVYNARPSDLTIIKEWADADGASGMKAHVRITNTDTNVVEYEDVEITDRVTVNLQPGNYLIEEIKVEDGKGNYVLNTDDTRTRTTVNIPEKTTCTLTNERISAGLKLTKTAEADNLENLWWEEADVSYTITPEETNSLPLTSYVLSDTGLTMKAEDTEGHEQEIGFDSADYNTYIRQKYAITSVSLSKVSHNVTYLKDAQIGGEIAIVRGYDFDDQLVKEVTVDVSQDAAPGQLTVSFDRSSMVKRFTVTYEDTVLKNSKINAGKEDGQSYVLGRDFKAGQIQVGLHLFLQDAKDAAGQDLKSVTEVTNHAEAVLNYLKPDGEGKVTGEPIVEKSEDDVQIPVNDPDVAVVTVNKTVDPEKANPMDNDNNILTYTIRISNLESAKGDMTDPVLIDPLPLGTEFIDRSAKVEGEQGSQITESDNGFAIYPDESNGRQIVRISYDGDLKPGDDLVIQLQVKVLNAALAYGFGIQNTAYVTSNKELGQSTATNPKKASFKYQTGTGEIVWPSGNLRDVSEAVEESYGHYAYILSSAAATMSLSNSLYVYKEVKGNEDSSYQTGTSTVTMITQDEVGPDGQLPEDNGQVWFRLNLLNGSVDTDITGIRAADVVPAVGDTGAVSASNRGSSWPLYMVNGITVYDPDGNVLDPEKYTVYVTDQAYDAELRSQVTAFLDYEDGALGAAWEKADDNTDWSKVKAFVVDISDILLLGTAEGGEGQSMRIEYLTQADQSMTLEEKNDIVFRLAVNNFAAQYKYVYHGNTEEAAIENPITSGSVYVKLLPSTVQVGGHVWVDADNNGLRDGNYDSALAESYENYDFETSNSASNLVKWMMENPAFVQRIQLNHYQGDNTYPSGSSIAGTGDNSLSGNTFRFTDLAPAIPQTGETLYNQNGELIVSALVGSDPDYYRLSVSTGNLPEALDGITMKLAKTTWSSDGNVNPEGGYSRDPRLKIPADEQADNNFSGGNGNYGTGGFFVWPTTGGETDMTKDIGFVPYRSAFTIKKAGASGEALEGVKFRIYGPFAPGTAEEVTKDALNSNNLVEEASTDAKGEISLDGELLYLMDYIIVEEETLDGYTLNDASAEGFERLELEGVTGWILHAGQVGEYGTSDEGGKLLYDSEITVTNDYATGSLKLSKVDADSTGTLLKGAVFSLKGTPLSGDATFENAAANFAKTVNDKQWQTAAGISNVSVESSASGLEMTFTLDTGSVDFKQILPRGSYTLSEVTAPAGFTSDAKKEFTIRNDGDGADYTGSAAITNKPQQFAISKVSEETGDPLKNAVFNLYLASDTGKEHPIWGANGKTTGEDGRVVFTMTGLSADTAYVLTETAPEGYQSAADITFRLIPKEEGSSELIFKIESGNASAVEEKNMAAIQIVNTLETGSITLSKDLIGDVTTALEDYEDDFSFTLALTQPLGYDNPVLVSDHVTDASGALTGIHAVKITAEGVEEIVLPISAGTISGIQLKDGESLTISGIYYGTSYTVTEDQTISTGFELAGAVINGTEAEVDAKTSSVSGETDNAYPIESVTVQNQVKKATISLVKTFDSNIPDEDKMPVFQIYDITDHAAEPYESAADAESSELVAGSEFGITWDSDQKTGYGTSPAVLIPGRTYQIVEVLNSDDEVSAGYTAKVSEKFTVTVGENNVLEVSPSAIDMENNRTKGWITVKKNLLTYDEEAIQESRTFYYRIYKVEENVETALDLGELNGTVLEGDSTIGVITNHDQAQSYFVDFGTYRVVEVNEDGTVIDEGSSSLDYNVSNPDDIVLELDNEHNNTVSAEITNKENPLGSITIVKMADWAEKGKSSFHFLVQDSNGRYITADGTRTENKTEAILTIQAEANIPYDDDAFVEVGEIKVSNVPYGTYTVTEVDADGNSLPVDYAYKTSYKVKVGDGAETSGNFGIITFADRNMTVTVQNEIGRAGMEIEKTFDDTSAIPADENLPTFTIYRIIDENDPISSADDTEGREPVGKIQIERQSDDTFKGTLGEVLIPGYHYQAVENLSSDEISQQYDPLVSDVFTVEVSDDGNTIPVVTFANPLENKRQRGYLQIRKSVENSYGESMGDGREFYYIVEDAEGNAIEIPEEYRADSGSATVGKILANTEMHVIQVPFGTYQVYETDENGTKYDAENPNSYYQVTNPEPITIEIGNADVTDKGTLAGIQNQELDLGRLTITKQADYADAGSSFYFLVADGRGQYLTPDGDLVDQDVASRSEAKWTITAEEDVTYVPDTENEGHGQLAEIGSLTVEGIPYGTYTVTEVDAEGNPLNEETYAYEVSSQTVIVDGNGQSGIPVSGGTGEIDINNPAMAVTVTNLVKKTHLTIEKTFDSHVPSEENLPKFAVYQLADPNRPITSPDEIGEGDIQVATVSIASRSDGSRTYYGGETDDILIPGYSYQAVEILADDEISKLYDPLTGENHVMTVTLEEDGMAVNALAYTAENIRSYGYLTVTKELFDYYGESLDDVRTFYYRIRNTETGEYVTIEPEYRPENAQDLTQVAEITTAAGDENVHFVKYGTYEIVETDENGNVYNDSESLISGFVNGLLGRETNPTYIVENPEPVEIILDNADTASASIANRERALGELTIVKETDWAESGQTEFYFTVQNEKGELLDAPAQGLAAIASLFKSQDARKIWTITADRTTDTMAEVGRLTIGELPYGIYTVTEVDQNGDALGEYPYTVSYQVEVRGKDAVSSAEEGQGELDYQHPSMTVTVTNTRNKGYLTVRKNLQDYQGNTLTGTGRQFYFTVLDEDGNAVELPEEFRYEGQQYVSWITDNTSRELFLPYGTYRVLETDEEGRPYNAQNENLLYEVTTPDAVELSLANADSAEAVIVNKEKAIGSLTVTKRVNRTANGTTFYFIVTNSKGERMPMPDENGNPTEETIWRISASRNVMTDTAIGSLTLKNLPYDTYTVTEVRENGEALADSYIYNVSYETTAQGVTASGQSGTITIDARDMDVTVTNTRKTGGGSGDGDGGGGGGSDGGGGGSTITVTTDVPTASITDPGIPLSPYPGDGSVIIPEGEVPLFGLPKTGDNSISAAGLAGIMLAALLSACGIIRKRKKEEES